MSTSILQRIGITAKQERLYRQLVEAPDQTAESLAITAKIAPASIEADLAALIELGLVAESSPQGTYTATDPEAAISVLIRREQEKLDSARLESIRLTQQLRAHRQQNNVSSIVEVLTGDALAEQWHLGQRSAQDRIRMTDRPPYFNAPDLSSMQTQRRRMAEGLTYQVVYDQATFEDPAHTNRVMTAVEWGEQARVTANVPIKIVLVDDSFAMVMITRNSQYDEPTVILVRPSALLDALSALFDLLWSRGVRIRGDSGVETDGEVPEKLLGLMAMGLKDEAIAIEMGVTVRTVRRRIRELYEQLGVHNRFQAGVAAKTRGWL